MADTFVGTGVPLNESGQQAVLEVLGVGAAELWAVLSVETSGFGYLSDRRPQILFERHVFSKRTNSRFDKSHVNISNPEAGGYGAAGAHQYDRLLSAIELSRPAALESASWGIGQLMGFNHAQGGFMSVDRMVESMMASENHQLMAMGTWIVKNNLHKALSKHDWLGFARGYNGTNFAVNHYNEKLASAFSRYTHRLPDLLVRQAQVYLKYLGFRVGSIDGLAGSATFKALNAFQSANGLTVEDKIDDSTIASLKEKIID